MDRKENVALVTGTSAGIGAATAEALLNQHWTVIGISRRPVVIDNPLYRHFTLDLGDPGALGDFAENELAPVFRDSSWQRVGLVNNAAVVGALRGLHEVDPRELARVFAVNAVAPIFLMGFMIREISAATRLRIANISSGAATQGIPGLVDYCASKAALRLAGMALAAELDMSDWSGRARGAAAILSYEPGVVDTNMQDVARATTPAEFPSHDVFCDFADHGDLHQPGAVVGEIVDFLAGSQDEPFSERRFGGY